MFYFEDLSTDEYINDSLIWEDEAYGYYAEDTWSDVEADADTLASAGMGTDEDYGWYGYEDAAMESALFGDC